MRVNYPSLVWLSKSLGKLGFTGGGGGGDPYVLPIATSSLLGGIKVGNTLTIDADGILNAKEGGGVTFADIEGDPLLNLNLATLFNDKVDKVVGKSLTTNDFTNALLTKLNGIQEGAQVNPDLTPYATNNSVDIKLNDKENKFTLGTRLSFTADRQLNIDVTNIPYSSLSGLPTIPTLTSQLTNDSGFVILGDLSTVAQTGSYNDLLLKPTNLNQFSNADTQFINKSVTDLVNYYTKAETLSTEQIEALLSTSFSYRFVDTPPTIEDAEPFIFYFVPIEGETNVYAQYILDVESTPNKIIQIGDTRIDLENYFTKAEITTLLTSYALNSSISTVGRTGNYADLIGAPDIADETQKAIIEYDIPNKTFLATHYEPIFTKNTAFNKNFGEGEDEVVRGNKVLAPVPPDAKFTDTVFDPTTIQNALIELNARFDNTATLQGTFEDGTTTTIEVVIIPATPAP